MKPKYPNSINAKEWAESFMDHWVETNDSATPLHDGGGLEMLADWFEEAMAAAYEEGLSAGGEHDS